MGCRGAGDSEDSLTQPRSAGELCARVRLEWWEDVKDAAESGRAGVGDGLADLGKNGPRGEVGESTFSVDKSEILLARRPSPLGGRISGEGGDGDLLGERGHGTLEMCWTALFEDRVRLLRRWNLEAMVDTLLRMDIDREEREVEEIVPVDGECLRLGVWLATSRFLENGNLGIKAGMTGEMSKYN